MIKKLFVVLFLFAAGIKSGLSQTAFSMGVNGGLHFNQLNNENDDLSQPAFQTIEFKQNFPNYKSQNLPGWNAMLDFQFGSPGVLSLASGIGWTRINHQTSSYHIDSTGFGMSMLGVGTTHLDYIDLPVSLSLTIPLDFYDTRRVNFRLGPQVSYLLNYGYVADYQPKKQSDIFEHVVIFNGVFRQTYYDSAYLQYNRVDTFDVSPYSKITMSIKAEFNAEYDLTDYSYVTIGIYGQWGLMDPENKKANVNLGNSQTPLLKSYWNLWAGDNRVFGVVSGVGDRKKTSIAIYGLFVGFHQKF